MWLKLCISPKEQLKVIYGVAGFRLGSPERKITKSADNPFSKTDMHAFMKIDPAKEPLKDEIFENGMQMI